jgi:hypothetical protein
VGWKMHADHKIEQETRQQDWYSNYKNSGCDSGARLWQARDVIMRCGERAVIALS